MLGSGGDEEEVARFECIPAAVMKQDAASAGDDLNLILHVRGLLSRPRRRNGESRVERAVPQDADGMLAVRTRDCSSNFHQADDSTALRVRHPDPRIPGLLPHAEKYGTPARQSFLSLAVNCPNTGRRTR
jgi:hypothetical protein